MNDSITLVEAIGIMTEYEDTLPVDLTDEKVSKRPLWDDFLSEVIRRNPSEEPVDLLGLSVVFSQTPVRQKIVQFGNAHKRKYGNLTTLAIRRYDHECLLMLKSPLYSGEDRFLCRASSEDFAAIVRLIVKSFLN